MAPVQIASLQNELSRSPAPSEVKFLLLRPSDYFPIQLSTAVDQKLVFQGSLGLLRVKDAKEAASVLQSWVQDKTKAFQITLLVHPGWTALNPAEVDARVMVAFQIVGKAVPVTVLHERPLQDMDWHIVGKVQLAYLSLLKQRANQIDPETFVTWCGQLFGYTPAVQLRVLSTEQCLALGMHAFVAMGHAATKKSRVLIAEYVGRADAPRVALVGKGVTFDSGGLNLKPDDAMSTMYTDKAGACAVMAAVYGLALKKAPVNVVAVAGLLENAIGPQAVHVDDILPTMSGKKIEIKNTDCEGRVLLADVLWYTGTKLQPAIMVDMATLTGSIHETFHQYRGAVFGTNMSLVQKMYALGEALGEKVWPMPLEADLDVSSRFADVRNYSKDEPDGLFAARFLSEFVPPTVSAWLHIDCAGMVIDKDDNLSPTGPRLLMSFVESLQ